MGEYDDVLLDGAAGDAEGADDGAVDGQGCAAAEEDDAPGVAAGKAGKRPALGGQRSERGRGVLERVGGPRLVGRDLEAGEQRARHAVQQHGVTRGVDDGDHHRHAHGGRALLGRGGEALGQREGDLAAAQLDVLAHRAPAGGRRRG